MTWGLILSIQKVCSRDSNATAPLKQQYSSNHLTYLWPCLEFRYDWMAESSLSVQTVLSMHSPYWLKFRCYGQEGDDSDHLWRSWQVCWDACMPKSTNSTLRNTVSAQKTCLWIAICEAVLAGLRASLHRSASPTTSAIMIALAREVMRMSK